MKKLFFAAMALATVVSCSKNVDDVSGVTADGQTAFISVSLKAAGEMTRAEATNPESFQYGSKAENTINNATFYFFDAVGDAYTVDTDNAVEVNTKTLTANNANPVENIEAYSNVILVIKESQNTPPAKMVALINVENPAAYANKTLAQLQTLAVNHSTTNGFVMSNSVYEANGAEVVATEILPENIFTTPDPEGEVGDAYVAPENSGVKPVEIFVERVAAKVKVNVSNKIEGVVNVPATDNTEAYTIYPVADVKDTYVKVRGWDVTNAAVESNLIKDYATTNLFSPVNNAAFHRSYWATTIASANPTHGFTFNAIAKAMGTEAYYNENTLSPSNAEGWFNENNNTNATKASQLIVAAQLVDSKGNAKEFARWYGKDYENGEKLQAAMINNAAKQIFVLDSTDDPNTEEVEPNVFTGIAVKDVEFYQVSDQTVYVDPATYAGDRRYEVRVKAKDGVTYYHADGKTTYTADEVTAILAKIEPAMIWAGGMTYYYTLINHYGDADGMVRNHIYDITISGFKGIGTPVYDPTKIIIPEVPVEQETYHLTAEINVLSWALVSQNVELGF